MPETETPVASPEAVDYTQQLEDISANLTYLKTYFENASTTPAYEQRLLDIASKLDEISGKMVVNDDGVGAEITEISVISADLKEVKQVLSKGNEQTYGIYNATILSFCGLGVLIGVICALIFSNFVRH